MTVPIPGMSSRSKAGSPAPGGGPGVGAASSFSVHYCGRPAASEPRQSTQSDEGAAEASTGANSPNPKRLGHGESGHAKRGDLTVFLGQALRQEHQGHSAHEN
jgi:hypothetical protein